MIRSFWPRSLPGQLMLLVAILLFVAQAINFALLLNGRRQLRYAQYTVPAINRVVDSMESLRSGQPVVDHHGMRQTRTGPVSLIPTDRHDAPQVEQGIRDGLATSGIKVGTIATMVRDMRPGDMRFRHLGPRRAARMRRLGNELLIAVELPAKGWLNVRMPWPGANNFIFWQLIAQTLVIYLVTLIPMFWIGRRIARPLRDLTAAARSFDPTTPGTPVAERGPGDVRAVITAFNNLSDRVTAMLDEKDRMLGAIGHDLRTPLAALRVRIESVEDEGDRSKMADTIDEMNRTLDDILSLARLGRPSEPATQVDLSALVDAVVDDFRDIGADVTAVDAPRMPVLIRPSLMRRALRNLIENAVKYAGSAEVALRQDDGHVSIEVADQGPGIPDAQLAAVFDPFTRLETSRNRETGGIGLGLALARAIVREAGGDIILANRDGGGLSATIRLPRRRG
ncbi:sensor histidine kinase [Stakelama marina]|uniref:histidine kinase n=1 Tax=Stakelama marina TaxID=2826939 RepID=A0A8T4I8V2_9SPHN|nr:HAMP domain-containing sensor histidine kinase [Stakelama marina]MBR0551418.1 HAMP domain-containing histidine kinase [Stakelama marina]